MSQETCGREGLSPNPQPALGLKDTSSKRSKHGTAPGTPPWGTGRSGSSMSWFREEWLAGEGQCPAWWLKGAIR